MQNFKSVKDKADEWGLSPRHVQYLCRNGTIDGAVKVAEVWLIPADAASPAKKTKPGDEGFHFVGTKKKIFDSAIQLFMLKSFDGVSLRDIADQVGVQQSTIYNHFKSKQEILDVIYAFYRHYYLKDRPSLSDMAIIVQTKSLPEIIEALRYNFNENYVEQLYQITKIIFQRISVDAQAREIAKTLMMEAGIQYVEEVFNMGIECGRFAPFDTHALAILISSARNYTLLNWICDPSAESMMRTLEDEQSLYQYAPLMIFNTQLY